MPMKARLAARKQARAQAAAVDFLPAPPRAAEISHRRQAVTLFRPSRKVAPHSRHQDHFNQQGKTP
jgi:hypothetical protein